MEQAKKERILTEAARAFSKRGFKKTSVDDIAKAAGVAKGTVYLACESKADLFYQALHREVRHWVAEVSKLIDPRQPADQLLAVMALAALERLERSPLVRDLLLGKTRELLPQWTDRFDELRVLGTHNVTEVLKLGIRQKLFRADLAVERISTVLQDLQIAGYLFHGSRRTGQEMMEFYRAGLDLVLNGLRLRPLVVD